MIIVSNTTPILSLYKIGQIEVLKSLFKQVEVPRAVYNEINILGKDGYDIFNMASYLHVVDVQNKMAVNMLRLQLDFGEAEAVVLAAELGADALVLDEKKARKIAQASSQKVIGTIGTH